jgi:hypothetical protein
MYNKRAANALARINAKYGLALSDADFQVEISYGHADVTLLNAGDVAWSESYSATNAFASAKDNEYKLDKECRRFEQLRADLAKFELAAQNTEWNTELENALHIAMADFRHEWMNKMMDWSHKHYQYINDRKDEATRWIQRYRRISRSWFFYNHSSICAALNAKKRNLFKILIDAAAHMDKVNYLAMMKNKFANHFESCVKKMTEKCDKFNVDANSINILRQNVTERGFELVLTDKTANIIDARIIWCAENSMLVAPHARYIVTQRKKL